MGRPPGRHEPPVPGADVSLEALGRGVMLTRVKVGRWWKVRAVWKDVNGEAHSVFADTVREALAEAVKL